MVSFELPEYWGFVDRKSLSFKWILHRKFIGIALKFWPVN
jgi:hypothetical protein